MLYPRHPSAVLQPGEINTIRQEAVKAEISRRLTPEQLALIHQNNWFKLFVPQQYGGLELPLPEVVQIEEAISWADGSMGWVVTLCAGACWFGGFLETAIARQAFQHPAVCFAGSGAPTGTAEITSSGYIVNGKWLYASGAPDATHFTANCRVIQNGNQANDASGNPLILSFLFLKEEVTLLNSWHTIGMIATASESYEVSRLTVPKERAFEINPTKARVISPLYRYPFLQLAETTLAANISGMALHFMDLCGQLFQEKNSRKGNALIEHLFVKNKFQTIQQQLGDARREMYAALDISWHQCSNGKDADAALMQEVSTAAHQLAETARKGVDELYPLCGLNAANPDSGINRVWRDMHTASQHTLLAFGSNY